MTETPTTKDQAQQAAGTALDEGRHVAATAAQEARSVAGEAQTHVKGLLDDTLTQVEEQGRAQRDRAAQTLQTFADDLDEMASAGTSGPATDLARQAGQRARALGQHLDGREPRDLLDDVRGFARRRPGTFLAGALLAGVVAGRLARGARDAASTGGGGGASEPTGAAATPVTPATTAVGADTEGGASSTVVPPSAPAHPPTVTGADDPAVAPGVAPLGVDDPAVGAAVPPTATGRYEP